MTDINDDGEIDYDYEDLCVGCDKHDTCHVNGCINYEAIDECSKSLNEQVLGKPKKEPLPKEKVCFT